MKLSETTNLGLSEARYLFNTTILEDGEGPRWKFNYDNWHNDPKPDILLLGAYKHPSTGNNLVGGINLNYLDNKTRDKLARNLPQIMEPNNLKRRYWVGRNLVPEVFNSFYRTYNSQLIRGVSKDILYPKYGFLKTAQNWLSKKYKSLLKTKKQRELDAQPKYPKDLASMQDRLDQAVANLARTPSDNTADKPEIKAADQAFVDTRKDQVQVNKSIDKPMDQAVQDMNKALNTPGVQDAERYAIKEPEIPERPIQVDPKQNQLNKEKINKSKLDNIEKQNEKEIDNSATVDDNLDLLDQADQESTNDNSEDRLGEDIFYFSPILNDYVVEHINIF